MPPTWENRGVIPFLMVTPDNDQEVILERRYPVGKYEIPEKC